MSSININKSHIEHSEPQFGMAKKTLSIYILGFILCLILTFIPFYIVEQHLFAVSTRLIVLVICAIAQLFVQVICFLRMNTKTEAAVNNTMSFMFTIIIAGVLIGGSLWIMLNMNYNMMGH